MHTDDFNDRLVGIFQIVIYCMQRSPPKWSRSIPGVAFCEVDAWKMGQKRNQIVSPLNFVAKNAKPI